MSREDGMAEEKEEKKEEGNTREGKIPLVVNYNKGEGYILKNDIYLSYKTNKEKPKKRTIETRENNRSYPPIKHSLTGSYP